ncbi:mfs transporter [Lasallia pustulata]|uniref:Mfs transporter n=1 Tax=Lasallia pustulata TaxID=136370 RepID=A0A1W5CT13_9LECA|nr:mfs transporter [Lasallia pustulata]
MARLSEPLTQTSLQSYMFYQLKSFDPSLPDSTISGQAGMLQGAFTAAQFATAMLWGRAADADWGGRKKVIVVAFFRIVGGALNGNVAVMRTMISEIIKEKKFQSRAFLMLPMCYNIGVIIGPILGGLLADPVESYPAVFGENSVLGGKNGVWWMKHWPYALPNLLSAFFLFAAATGVIFGLEETLDSLRGKPDFGLQIGHHIASLVRRMYSRRTHRYSAVSAEEMLNSSARNSYSLTRESYDLEVHPQHSHPQAPAKAEIRRPARRKLPIRRIWTRNVICTLLVFAIFAFHVGTFQSLWYIFLSTPRFDPSRPEPPSHTSQSLPFSFTGGLGMPPRTVGFAMSILGIIGIILQLLVYPAVNQRLGTLRSYRCFLCLFPIAYCLSPYLAIVPSTTAPPAQASGPLLWAALAGVVFIQGLARTFTLPANTILMNNCSPHPSVLGTIHGIAQSVSTAVRTVGPVAGGWLYGLGLRKGVVGGVWWGLAGVAIVGQVATGWVYEGNGHEILLEGEEEEEGGEGS